jgi:hypothetical protein
MESYEATMRNEHGLFNEESRVAALEAVHAREWLPREYRRVAENTDLNEEAKVRLAQEALSRRGPKVEATAKRAKEVIGKQAQGAYERSIPKPTGQPLSAPDATTLVADQLESQRISAQLQKLKEKKGPFEFDTASYLRQEYRKGLERGGAEGGTICRAVRRAAEEEGVDESWLDGLRSTQQLESLDKARRLQEIAFFISTTPPSPPKSLQPPRRLSRRPEQHRPFSGTAFVMPSRGEPVYKREATHIGASDEATATLPAEHVTPEQKKTPPARKKSTARKRAWK